MKNPEESAKERGNSLKALLHNIVCEWIDYKLKELSRPRSRQVCGQKAQGNKFQSKPHKL